MGDYARKRKRMFSKIFTKCCFLKGIAKEKPTQKVLFLIGNNSCSLQGTTKKICKKCVVPYKEQQLFPVGNNKGNIHKMVLFPIGNNKGNIYENCCSL